MLSSPTDLTPVEIFGKTLTPVSKLGEGEWGITWHVTDEHNHHYTLKLTDTQHGKNEARINHKLNRLKGFELHPEDSTGCALLLSYIEGNSLHALLQPYYEHIIVNEMETFEPVFKPGYLNNPIESYASGLLRNLTLAIGVTKALAALHEVHISHGDVDLHNYVLCNAAHATIVKAIDFGLSKDVSEMRDPNNVAFAIGGDIMDLQVLLSKMLPVDIMQSIDRLYDNDKIPSLKAVQKLLLKHLHTSQIDSSNAIVNAFKHAANAPKDEFVSSITDSKPSVSLSKSN
jgi:serine/threonine protein kinase